MKRRILDLGIEGRPMRKPNKPWTEDEVEKLLRMKEQGYDWIHMSQELEYLKNWRSTIRT